jgi:hypothetical protein
VHTINKPGRGEKIVRMGASLPVVDPCGPGLTRGPWAPKASARQNPTPPRRRMRVSQGIKSPLDAANWGLHTVESPRRVTQRQTRRPVLDAAASSESAQAVSFPSVGHRCVLCPGWSNGSYDVRCTWPPVPIDGLTPGESHSANQACGSSRPKAAVNTQRICTGETDSTSNS